MSLRRTHVPLLVVRTFIGIAFLFHGAGKATDIVAFAAEFGIPTMLAGAATYTQMLAGAQLIVGFATRLASLALGSTMAIATLQLIGRGESFVSPHGHSWEASAFYLVGTLTLSLLGPGKYSMRLKGEPA